LDFPSGTLFQQDDTMKIEFINTALPADEVNISDAQMTERLRRLIRRRHELVAEGQEIERELREIDRELLERRIEEQFVDSGRSPNL
jgi:hypothetical protein